MVLLAASTHALFLQRPYSTQPSIVSSLSTSGQIVVVQDDAVGADVGAGVHGELVHCVSFKKTPSVHSSLATLSTHAAPSQHAPQWMGSSRVPHVALASQCPACCSQSSAGSIWQTEKKFSMKQQRPVTITLVGDGVGDSVGVCVGEEVGGLLVGDDVGCDVGGLFVGDDVGDGDVGGLLVG